MRVPAAFDFDTVFERELAEVPTTAGEKENLKNTAYFVLDALGRNDAKAMKALDRTGYLPLNADLLKANCDNRYRRVLEVLVKTGVVEQASKAYAPGRSRRYRLSKAMQVSGAVFKELDGTVRKRYLRHQAAKERQQKQGSHSLKHLLRWLDGARFSVRLEELHRFIELSFPMIRGRIGRLSLSVQEKSELLGRATMKVNHQLTSIRELLQGDFSPSFSGRDERLHTLLVRMKRELRSFLLYDGEALVSLDIRSSQPYFLLVLLSRAFHEGKRSDFLSWQSVVTGEGFTGRSLLLEPSSLPPSSLYSMIPLGSSEAPGNQTLLKWKFPEIQWQKGFYRDFARKRKGREPSKKEVEKAKKETMWMLFEPKAGKFNTPAFKDFTSHFPAEAAIVKAVHGMDPKLLPLLLQRIEARILLHGVARTIARQQPDAPLLTVHDAILTTPAFAAKVKKAMARGLKKYTGVAPGIKEELHTPEKEFASVTTEIGGTAHELTGMESFAKKIVDATLKSFKKAKRGARKRGEEIYSFAHVKLESPLLLELPEHEGRRTFSPRYYNPNHEIPDEAE